MDFGREDELRAFLNVLESPISTNLRTSVDKSSVEETINTIQTRINNLIACQQALRGVLNGFAPILRLPREVLSHMIFDLVVNSPFTGKSTFLGPYRPYLVLSQVCRSWRRLALDNPVLWTSPDFQSPKLAQMMLNRAGNMPLSVSFHDVDPALVYKFTTELQRLRDVTMTATQPDFDLHASDLLALIINRSKPPLESMNIRLQSFTRLPMVVFDYIQHPRFKHLTLENCTIPWSSDRLIGLSSLSVTIGGPRASMKLPGLFQLLKQNPGLVNLSLIGVASAREKLTNSSPFSGTIALPKLQYLNIDGYMHESAHLCFFASIQAPQLLFVRIPVIVPDDDPHSDYSRFALAVRMFLERIEPAASVRAITVNPSAFFVRDSEDPHVSLAINISCARPDAAANFKLRLFFEAGVGLQDDNAQLRAAALLRHLPVEQLDALTVRVSGRAAEHIKLNELWTAASSLPELATFNIRHDKYNGLDPELLELLTAVVNSQPVNFPALKSFVWESDWSSQFRAVGWRKALISFVKSTQPRAMLPWAIPCDFKLHQRWPTTSGGRKEAKVLVGAGSQIITGEFQHIDDSENGMESVLEI